MKDRYLPYGSWQGCPANQPVVTRSLWTKVKAIVKGGTMKGKKCECSDPGCPKHTGQSYCTLKATRRLFRIDMEDRTGTAMCEKCFEDALDSGMFDTQRNFYSGG